MEIFFWQACRGVEINQIETERTKKNCHQKTWCDIAKMKKEGKETDANLSE